MPKSTKSNSTKAVSDEKVDLSTFYQTVETISVKVRTDCLANVPEELPNDNNEVNRLFETIKELYIEFSRLREFFGTSLHSIGEVMRKFALHRAKANACLEPETEPESGENLVNSDNEETNDVDEKSDNEDDKPKKKSKDKEEEKPVEVKKSSKDKKKETKVDSDVEEEKPVEEKKSKDKKKK
jgi:hypothetical protein